MKSSTQARAGASIRQKSIGYSEKLIGGIGAVGLVILSGIFFSFRQNDLGQFPNLLSHFLQSFGQGKILSTQAVAECCGGIFIASLILLAWIGLGALVIRHLAKNEFSSNSLRVAWYCGIGSSLWSTLWFFLGLANLFSKSLALVLILIAAPFGAYELGKFIKARIARDKAPNNPLTKIAISLTAISLFLAFISALAPLTGKDAMVYRFAIPKLFVNSGGFADVGTNIFGYLSFGAEMNGVWGMLLGNFINERVAEIAFNIISFLFCPLLLLTIFGIVTEVVSDRGWALTAAAIVAAVPTLYQVAGSGYVDHSLTFFITLAIYAVMKWWENSSRENAALVAFSLGGALAIKFLALFAFLSIFLIVLFKSKQAKDQSTKNPNAILLNGILALCCGGLLASPWYLRTWLKTGSPVFPFYAHLWKGSAPGWDAARSQISQILLSQYGGENKGIFDYLLTPIKLSIESQPELPANYDGVLGITFLLGLPLIIWGLWKLSLRPEIKIAAVMAGGWYFCWLFTSEQLRFLLPVIPALAIALTGIAAQIGFTKEKKSTLLQSVLLLSAFPGMMVIGCWFLDLNPVRTVLGGEAREEFLSRRLDYFSYYKAINHDLSPNAKIWLINLRNDTIHLERQFFADYVFEDYTIAELIKQSSDLNQLRKKIGELGVTHILLRHDVLLDYARTPIVDEKKNESENREKFKLLNDYLAQGKILKRDDKFMLLEVTQ